MSAHRIALLVLALAGCNHAKTGGSPPAAIDTAIASDPSSHPVGSDAAPPPQVPIMTSSRAPLYVTPWVDGTRSSRSAASARSLGALARVADFASVPGSLAASHLGKVEHVLAAPDGEHVVVRGSDGVWIFERTGKLVGSIRGTTSAGLTFATRTDVFHGLVGYDWIGAQGPLSLYVPSGVAGRVWATHVMDDQIFFVNQEPIQGNHDARQAERVDVVGNHLVAGGPAKKIIGGDILQATLGMAAIARDGRIVVLTTTGDLRVYAPRADASWHLAQESTAHVRVAAYDVSVVGDSIAVVEPDGVPAVDEGAALGPYQAATDVFLRFPEMTAKWSTVLHVLGMNGAEQRHVSVPFEVLQPPIDGGDGRIYLAGTGFAAVQDGHVEWSQPRGARLLATAFSGGEVAMVTGGALRVVDRSGNVRQSFSVPNETFATPPAIAEDGSVWVASQGGLFAAR